MVITDDDLKDIKGLKKWAGILGLKLSSKYFGPIIIERENGELYAECWSTADAFCALAKATQELGIDFPDP